MVWPPENLRNTAETEGLKSRWTERARLLDSRAPILQVAFAPPHLDLKLVTLQTTITDCRQVLQATL